MLMCVCHWNFEMFPLFWPLYIPSVLNRVLATLLWQIGHRYYTQKYKWYYGKIQVPGIVEDFILVDNDNNDDDYMLKTTRNN